MAETGQIKIFGDQPTMTETALAKARKKVYKEERWCLSVQFISIKVEKETLHLQFSFLYPQIAQSFKDGNGAVSRVSSKPGLALLFKSLARPHPALRGNLLFKIFTQI